MRQPIATNGGDWISRFGSIWNKQIETLSQKFGDKIVQVRKPSEYPTDVPIIDVKKDFLVEVLSFLKHEAGFEYHFLSDLTASDEMKIPRFEVIYHLFSHSLKCRIRVKTAIAEDEEVPTVISVWKSANWAEREVFDMFGIRFQGHPDLRRILMDVRWVGHPLRKDYPLRGYQVFTDAEPVEPTLLE